jgi:hypothetical protein
VASLAPPLRGAGRDTVGPAARHGRRAPHRGWHTPPRRDAPAARARRRGAQPGRHRAAPCHRARTPGRAATARAGVGAAPTDAPARHVAGRHGLYSWSSARKSWRPREGDATGDGRRDHRAWLECASLVVVSRALASLDATQAPWASLTGAETSYRAVVWEPRLAVELPSQETGAKFHNESVQTVQISVCSHSFKTSDRLTELTTGSTSDTQRCSEADVVCLWPLPFSYASTRLRATSPPSSAA